MAPQQASLFSRGLIAPSVASPVTAITEWQSPSGEVATGAASFEEQVRSYPTGKRVFEDVDDVKHRGDRSKDDGNAHHHRNRRLALRDEGDGCQCVEARRDEEKEEARPDGVVARVAEVAEPTNKGECGEREALSCAKAARPAAA